MRFFSNLRTDFRRNRVIYFMLAPIILWYIIFCYVPMGGLLMAFQNYAPALGILKSQWIGLRNFSDFFGGIYAWRLVRNTFLLGFYDLIFSFPAPIIFALLLNELRSKYFKKAIQTISYLPYFISMVVVCGMIVDFTSSSGFISNLVAFLTGTEPVSMLGKAEYFRPIYILSNIWQGLGYGSIIYIAALAGVDQELYEAAVIDGANRWQQTLHITLPGISSTIIIMLIMKMGMMMSVGFDKVLLLYNPSTYETSDVISTYVYRMAFENGNYGMSTAVGLFNSVINTTFLVVTNAISRKYSETSLF